MIVYVESSMHTAPTQMSAVDMNFSRRQQNFPAECVRNYLILGCQASDDITEESKLSIGAV
jgi:hypothetical protein